MNKSIKGALAAGVGGVLLLGGATTLAFWTDTGTVTGSSINSGHLKLVSQSCLGWKLDGGAAFTTQLIVPGDTLTQVCTYTVAATGAHLLASLAVSAPTFTGAAALYAELTATATYKKDTVAVSAFPTTIADGNVIEATVVVSFDGPAATNGSNNLTGLTAALSNITVTATKAHTP